LFYAYAFFEGDIVWCLIACVLSLVEPATDLQLAAREARQEGLAILLYVSRSDCTFCRRFEAQVLHPLLRSGAIDDRILIRELVWDLPGPVIDFKGRAVTPTAVATAYDAKLTPTLLFLDSQGREIVSRITGYVESDYYSYYLEAAIDKAATTLQQRIEGAEP
jgi:thioredoxin-related protein